MAQPKLAAVSSGHNGRGYKNPFTGEVVPGVTTVLKRLSSEGLINWHVEQTALHAITHVDELLSRSEEAGLRFLQYYTRRLKESDLDDPTRTVFTAADGVLSDRAELGNFMHDYAEDDLNGNFPTDPWREDQAEMVLAWEEWRDSHDIQVVQTEATVFGNGWAGTFDAVLWIDGKLYLIDFKTSRAVQDSHYFQLSALGSAMSMALEVPEGTEGAVHHKIAPSIAKHHRGQTDSWWVETVMPSFTNYGIVRIRPDDWDTKGNFIPAHCHLHEVSQEIIDAGFEVFENTLKTSYALKKFKDVLKQAEKEAENER